MRQSDLQKLLAAAIESHTAAVMAGDVGLLGDDDERTGPEAAKLIPDARYQSDPELTQFTGDRWAFHFTYTQDYP